MEHFLKNLYLSSAFGVILTFIITLIVLFFVFPLAKKIIKLNLTEDECEKNIFIVKYKDFKKIVWFFGLGLIFINVALSAISPSVRSENQIFDNKSSQSYHERVNKERTRSISDREISLDGVLDPMRDTGEASRQRIREMTDYRTKRIEENEEEQEEKEEKEEKEDSELEENSD